MSTFRGSDNCTDTILEFIAGGVPEHPVGEAAGNYNAYFGHPDSTTDLSVRTINGIYEFQAWMLTQDSRSSAVGRYEFLRDTLEGLQKELGLSGNELFTPAMQDRLGVRLLRRRGYSEWWRGQIDDAEFAHRLSMEWASLPDPQNDGRSFYDHDPAGNHTDTTVAAVLDMLSRARAAMPTTKQEHTMSDAPIAGKPVDIEAMLEAFQRHVDDRFAKIEQRPAAPTPNPGFAALSGFSSYVIGRLSEPSSWAGLPAVLQVLGLDMSADTSTQVVRIGVALAGLIAILAKERGTAPVAAKQVSNA